VSVDVSATALASVTNAASVDTPGCTASPCDSTTDPTTITQDPVLSIAKTHSADPGPWHQGDSGHQYKITVSNGSAASVGPTTGTVTVVDTIPGGSGLTPTAAGGTGWHHGDLSGTDSCAIAGSGTLADPYTITCARADTLTRGSSYPVITVSVDVAANAASYVVNGASVDGGGCSASPCDSTTDPTNIGNTWTLTVSKTGHGTGTVSSDVGAINCGATCHDSYVDGTDVTLSASADPGSTFLGWTDASCPGTGTCQVPMDQDRSVTAIFGRADLQVTNSHSDTFHQGDTGKQYTISLTNQGDGPTTAAVTVTEVPPPGLTVTALDGGPSWNCSVSTLSCTTADVLGPGDNYPDITVTVSVDRHAAASVINTATVDGGGCGSSPCDSSDDPTTIVARYDLTASTTGNGTGTVTSDVGSINCGSGGSTCQDTYDDGTDVTLTPSPDPGSTFLGWTGDCSGMGGCTVTMDQARAVTADFGIADLSVQKSHTDTFHQGDTGKQYTISVTNNGDGPTTSDVTVTENPPPSLTVTAMDGGPSWNCVVSSLICTTSDVLAPGDSYPDITVTVSVARGAPSSVVNNAEIDGGGCGSSPCDSTTDPTTIVPRWDLTVSKTGSGSQRLGHRHLRRRLDRLRLHVPGHLRRRDARHADSVTGRRLHVHGLDGGLLRDRRLHRDDGSGACSGR